FQPNSFSSGKTKTLHAYSDPSARLSEMPPMIGIQRFIFSPGDIGTRIVRRSPSTVKHLKWQMTVRYTSRRYGLQSLSEFLSSRRMVRVRYRLSGVFVIQRIPHTSAGGVIAPTLG